LSGKPYENVEKLHASTNVKKIEEYFAMLLKLLPEDAKIENVRNKMLDLRQGEEFLQKFQELKLKLSSRDQSWKEDDAVFAFKRALKPKVRFEVEKAKLTRLEQVYDIACKFERSIGNTKN
jgi:hypothetical protein